MTTQFLIEAITPDAVINDRLVADELFKAACRIYGDRYGLRGRFKVYRVMHQPGGEVTPDKPEPLKINPEELPTYDYE